MKYRLSHLAEYVFLRTLFALFRITPHRLALFVAWTWAAFFHFVGRFRVKAARHRIREVMGDAVTERDIRHIAWTSFRNLCFNLVEIVRFPRLGAPWAMKHIDMEEMHRVVLGYRDAGQGFIVALVHAGNWDLAGLVAEEMGIPSFFLARTQKNPLVNRLINGLREQRGSEVVDRDDPSLIKKSMRALKDGHMMAILIDLRNKTPGLPICYLGATANLGAGLGLLARQTGVPVIPVFLLRTGWTRHSWAILPPRTCPQSANKMADWTTFTQELADAFTTFVKNHPENYFWYNKRWVLQPLEETPPAIPSP